MKSRAYQIEDSQRDRYLYQISVTVWPRSITAVEIIEDDKLNSPNLEIDLPRRTRDYLTQMLYRMLYRSSRCLHRYKFL